MITIISGTNRKESKTLAVAKYYYKVFQQHTDEEVKLLSLEDIPTNALHDEMYTAEGQAEQMKAIQDEYMVPATKFFIVSPEYNGSFPGVLKLFIDAVSIRLYKETFKGKKAGLAGVASGRAGNLRGMDHLTAVLNHVGTLVMPLKLPISQVGLLMENDEIVNEAVQKAIAAQVAAFVDF